MHPTLEDQKQFWNWHWRNAVSRKAVNPWKARRHEELIALLRSLGLDHPRILDLGCGHGWFTEKLLSFGTVTGIDLSEQGIDIAKSRTPEVEFIAGNLYEYPLPAGHYDVLVTQEVIDHVDDQAAFVERAAYLLKPGGYFIVSCANRFVTDRLGEGEFETQPPDHIADYLSLTELKGLLSSRFRVLQSRTILPVAGRRGILSLVHNYHLNAVLGRIASPRYVEKLKERAGFGYQLLVLAQKPGLTEGQSR